MSYGYLGSFTTRYGHRDEVVEILCSGADGLRAAGCHLYLVGVSDTDPNVIWVTEVWESREHHDASLQLPETRAAIEKAMPLLTGEFTRQEVMMVGGLGLPGAG
ncbi:MAG TPA: putative quinol monooxygenase [Pseudonocardiaceae bacterium]|jgi:quinol monooxygenase YgiN|nr:putative quinol monooxygenase [Pseudonocardiaceae bacterium]